MQKLKKQKLISCCHNRFYNMKNKTNITRIIHIILLMTVLSACTSTHTTTSTKQSLSVLSPPQKHLYQQAITAMQEGKLLQARKLLQQLITQHDTLANLHLNMGIILLRQKSETEAENAFLRAAQLDPAAPHAHNQLGVLYRTQGKFKQAEKHYLTAIDIDGSYAYAHLNLGILYDLYMYQLEQALQHYQLYLKTGNKNDKQVEKWIIEIQRRLKSKKGT